MPCLQNGTVALADEFLSKPISDHLDDPTKLLLQFAVIERFADIAGGKSALR